MDPPVVHLLWIGKRLTEQPALPTPHGRRADREEVDVVTGMAHLTEGPAAERTVQPVTWRLTDLTRWSSTCSQEAFLAFASRFLEPDLADGPLGDAAASGIQPDRSSTAAAGVMGRRRLIDRADVAGKHDGSIQGRPPHRIRIREDDAQARTLSTSAAMARARNQVSPLAGTSSSRTKRPSSIASLVWQFA